MFIDIRAIGFGLTESIYQHVQTRLSHALAPFARRVMKVTTRLDDVNADRGGVDKRCRVVVTLGKGSVIVTETTHKNLYIAVDEVATRIRRSVKRALTRNLHRQRSDRQRPGALLTL